MVLVLVVKMQGKYVWIRMTVGLLKEAMIFNVQNHLIVLVETMMAVVKYVN